MADLLTAVLGGSLVFALTTTARAAGIPGDVRTHDAAIRVRDDQLATWIADRNYALECERRRLVLRLGAPPAADMDIKAWNLEANATDQDIADARARALHEYRDEERRAAIDVARIVADEGWPHRWYRKLRRRPVAALTAPARALPVLDSWREPSGVSVSEPPVSPIDATKRTLEDAIGSVGRTLPPP